MTTVHFSGNDRYAFTHGHAPRGFGFWGFEAEFGETRCEVWVPHSMTFTDAKKNVAAQIRVMAASHNFTDDVYVSVLT